MFQTLDKFKYWILGLLAVISVVLWPGVQHALELDNSISVWFMEDDPALVRYENYQQRFGNDESVVLVVQDLDGILTQENIQRLVQLTDALQSIPEIQSILGPASIKVPPTMMGGSSENLITEESTINKVKRDLKRNPYLKEQLFTEDLTAARLIINFELVEDFDYKRDDILDRVDTAVYSIFSEQEAFMGGVGVVFSGLNQLSKEDFALFLGLGYLLIFLFLLFVYRSGIILIYALLTVSVSTYLCLGIYGLAGYRLNLMTTLIPTIMVLLGILDVIHIIKARNRQPEATPLEILNSVFKPCLYTTLTTMGGFLSLLVSPMSILRSFGLYTAIGIFICLLLTFFFGLIFLVPLSRKRIQIDSTFNLTALYQHITAHGKGYLLFSFILMFGFGWGIFYLNNDTYTLGYLPDDNKVVTDHDNIEEIWGPYMPLEVVVEPAEGVEVFSPEFMQAGMEFSQKAAELAGVGETFGYVQLYQAGMRSMYSKKAARTMEDPKRLKNVDGFVRTLYPRLHTSYVDSTTGTARIRVFGKMGRAENLSQKETDLINLAQSTYGEMATVSTAGYLPLYAKTVRYAAQSQIYSLLLAFCFILLLAWIFLRDFKLALIALIPNVFPVIFILGVMGWLGIDLDIATASVSAIVLSFCIDDTLHFMYNYKIYRNNPEVRDACLKTLTTIGPVIIVTSLILLAGHSLMVFASLKTIFLFGLFTALAVIGAIYSHIIMLPLLLQRLDRRP